MRPLAEGLMAAPGDSLWQAFDKLAQNGLGRLAVLDGGRLVGYLSVKDVMHVLALASGPGGRRAVGDRPVPSQDRASIDRRGPMLGCHGTRREHSPCSGHGPPRIRSLILHAPALCTRGADPCGHQAIDEDEAGRVVPGA